MSGAATQSKPTVLVVEDEEPIRAIVGMALEMHGLRILTAGDAVEALRHSARHDGKIDLVITDVQLPGTSGPELVQRLLTDRPELHVLYISGGNSEKPLIGGATGRTAFLPKPFTPRDLVEQVRKILRPDAP